MHEAMRGNPRNVKVTLATLNNGDAVEKFDMALNDVLADMVDPNKDPDADRAITLTIKFKPKKRKGGHRYGDTSVFIACKAKFGPYQEIEEGMVVSEGIEGPEAHQDIYQEGDLDAFFSDRSPRIQSEPV